MALLGVELKKYNHTQLSTGGTIGMSEINIPRYDCTVRMFYCTSFSHWRAGMFLFFCHHASSIYQVFSLHLLMTPILSLCSDYINQIVGCVCVVSLQHTVRVHLPVEVFSSGDEGTIHNIDAYIFKRY